MGDTDILEVPLSARHKCRETLWRYMELCDVPAVEYRDGAFYELFAEQAVWEGGGERNKELFGRISGVLAIENMLEKVLIKEPAFELNTHYLDHGEWWWEGLETVGSCWKMLRISVRPESGLETVVSKLRVDFQIDENRALIKRYSPTMLQQVNGRATGIEQMYLHEGEAIYGE